MKRKDLARALRFLKSVENRKNGINPIERLDDSLSSESNRTRLSELGSVGGLERDWEVLDTCLNADDMILVASAYRFLENRGFLLNFGKFSSIGYYLFIFLCCLLELALNIAVLRPLTVLPVHVLQFWRDLEMLHHLY